MHRYGKRLVNSTSGKTLKLLLELKELQKEGRGSQKMVYFSPNTPFHYKEKSRLVFIGDMTPDARAEWQKYTEKVYDYPVITLDELIEKLESGEV